MARPFVTVLMPVRNEADFIARSVGSVLAQNYPTALFEVIVVDGASDDATKEIVAELFRSANVATRLLDNPRRIVPVSLNLGLENAQGDVIVRVDGHCEIPRDYLTRCVSLLEDVEAACVGGRIETVGEGPVAKAIAVAQASKFGVGGVAFRSASKASFVDTLAFGAYRRTVFEKIGRFDEELVRNQDDEFNFRLLQSGEGIWLDPTLVTRYYSRASLRSLWRQYREYGLYKVLVIRKRGAVPSARHLVPAAFVVASICAAGATLVSGEVWPMVAIAGPWLLVALAASIVDGRRSPFSIPLLVAAYATLHLSYGFGFLQGLIRWRGIKRDALKGVENGA